MTPKTLTPNQTTLSYIVLVQVEHSPEETPYQDAARNSTLERHFLPGPGEGIPLPAISIKFEGIIPVDGGLLR